MALYWVLRCTRLEDEQGVEKGGNDKGYHRGAALKPDSQRLSPILLGLSAVLIFVFGCIFVLGCANQGGLVERADRTDRVATADDAARFLADSAHTLPSRAVSPRPCRRRRAGYGVTRFLHFDLLA